MSTEVQEEQPQEETQKESEPIKKDITIKGSQKQMQSDKIIVTMYGIIRGPSKCQVCTMANSYFTQSDKQLYFKYNHVIATKPVARAIAKKKKITEMPYFRYRTPEDLDWKFIIGWNEQDWDELIPMIKNR